MRLVELRLVAFGPHQGVTFRFDESDGAVDVVLGANEAGKSTTLRAIRSLFYGIDERTPDAHTFEPKQLRIGATIRAKDGRVLSFSRRKGKKGTLLDDAGKALDDGVLAPFLQGVGEEMFETTFGLDHAALEAGARALLEGKGDVGESLFDAGLGGRGIHATLRALREDVERLHGRGNAKRPLNEALRELGAARTELRNAIFSPEKYKEARETIAARERAHAEKRDDVRALRRDLERLKRVERVRKVLAQLDPVRDERARLGDVPPLAEGATREREEAERIVGESARVVEEQAGKIADLSARKEALFVPEALVAIGEPTLDDLERRLATHRKESRELPALRRELAAAEEEARRLLVDARAGASFDDDAWRIDAATEAKLRELSRRRAGRAASLAKSDAAIGDLRERVAELEEAVGVLAPRADVEALVAATANARAEGDLEARLARATETRKKHETQAAALVATMGLRGRAPADVATLRVPSIEAVEDHAAVLRDVAARQRTLASRREEQRAIVAETTRALDAHERAGNVPTEKDLAEARSSRDRTVEGALRADAPASRVDATIAVIHDADVLADRLRWEASRVAEVASLEARRTAASAEIARVDDELRAVDATCAGASRAWADAWRDAGIAARAPEEARALVEAQAKLRDAVELAEDAMRDAAAIEARLEMRRRDLRLALATPPPEGTSLATLVAVAERVLAAVVEAEAKRAAIVRELETTKKRLARAERERTAESSHDDDRAWKETMRRLGLADEASDDEADAVLRARTELAQRVAEIQRLRRRIDAMTDDARRLEDDVLRLAREHAPELAGRAVEEGGAELLRRCRAARETARLRENVAEQLREATAKRDEAARRSDEARRRLDEMVRQAGVEDLVALATAERNAARARELDARLRELHERLAETAPIPVAELEAEARAVEPNELAAIEEREEDLKRAEEELATALAAVSVERDRVERREELYDPAEKKALVFQQKLAAARSLAEEVVKKRLAVAILEREVERYREEHQGPVVARAEQLFRTITAGSFQRLAVGFDDRDAPVLRPVRDDGKEVDVAGLSEGTRDQLYLALRLASLERWAARSEPIPLVLDDVLIQFDDDRARAALVAIGEVARGMQVLFFTHHARLVELATEALDDRAKVHRLVRRARDVAVTAG